MPPRSLSPASHLVQLVADVQAVQLAEHALQVLLLGETKVPSGQLLTAQGASRRAVGDPVSTTRAWGSKSAHKRRPARVAPGAGAPSSTLVDTRRPRLSLLAGGKSSPPPPK
jgi:hypothetical protein